MMMWSEEGYSIAVALSDSVVVSRRLTRADLSQLHARLSHILGARLEHQDLTGAEDD